MKNLRLLFTLLFTLASLPVQADVAVLIHGYLGSPNSWVASGVLPTLEARGWRFAGVLPGPVAAQGPGRWVYSVALPSLAPLPVQATELAGALRVIAERHPQEPLILVGHSAGGVVARLALVTGAAPHARQLITIAAPHLGTVRAAQALDAVDIPFPVSVVPDLFGPPEYQLLRDSRPLYVDLLPAYPGSLLDWLNHQPHPAIDYVAVVRMAPFTLGDELVPAFSQDLARVPALHGQVQTVVVGGGHSLNPADGPLIADLLERNAAP